MERWQNKLAVVTGASSGIGAAIAVELAKAGLIVVGLARRTDKIEELRCNIPLKQKGNLHAIECDLSKEEEIIQVFKKIDCDYGGISVLINNAGLMLNARLLERESSETLRQIVDVNVFGLINCTREAYLSMKKHEINDGHVIHINSLLGHKIAFAPDLKNYLNIYAASKYAVTALAETYRQDFIFENTKIKVTDISPGIVKTAITEANHVADVLPYLMPEDIAQAVLYALSTPPHVHIQELKIRPMGEPF